MLPSIRGVLLDLSGTLHVGDEAIKGAVDAVCKLNKANFPVKFVTNTSKESRRKLSRRLDLLGFPPALNASMFTSLTSAVSLCTSERLRPHLILAKEAKEEFSKLDQDNPNCVLVGLAPDKFHYESLTEAFRLLQDGAELVAINKSRYYKREDGNALGTGCFVAGLEFSSGKPARVVGKPEPAFFSAALEALNRELGYQAGDPDRLKKDEVLMVGDDVMDDVIGAQKAGFKGCLVRTGKYRQGDELKCDDGMKPELVFDSVTDLINELLNK